MGGFVASTALVSSVALGEPVDEFASDDPVSGEWETVSGEIHAATEDACAECADLTEQVMDPAYPRPPALPTEFRSTAHGWLQNLRRAVGGFNDLRTLSDTDQYTRYGPLGPLSHAFERAIVRNMERGIEGPARTLAIGAGQRLVEAQLKTRFGDQVAIHEIAPTYGALKGAVDVELPASGIDEADLPKDHFELIYSFFGNIYGRDQIKIMQKIVESLRVSGEALIMWKRGLGSDRMADQVRQFNRFFHDAGLDISVDSSEYDGLATSRDRLHVVWLRKRVDDVKVDDLFRSAAFLKKNSAVADFAAPLIRLSFDGPYFDRDQLSSEHLTMIVDAMIASAAKAMGRSVEELEGQLLNNGRVRDLRGNRLARHFMREFYRAYSNSAEPSPLEYNVPLSVLVTDFLHTALDVKYTRAARRKALIRTFSAIARR